MALELPGSTFCDDKQIKTIVPVNVLLRFPLQWVKLDKTHEYRAIPKVFRFWSGHLRESCETYCNIPTKDTFSFVAFNNKTNREIAPCTSNKIRRDNQPSSNIIIIQLFVYLYWLSMLYTVLFTWYVRFIPNTTLRNKNRLCNVYYPCGFINVS